MGWITLSQAQAGAGTTDTTNASAILIATWLEGQKAGYVVSHTHPIETVYSRDGIDLKQEIDITVKEYRGLAKDLAEFLARYLYENNTVQWTMYGITSTEDIHEAEITYGAPQSSYADTLAYKIGGSGTNKYLQSINSLLGHYFFPPSNGKLVEADAQRANAADGWMVRATTTNYIAPDYTSTSRVINKAFIPLPPTEAWNGIVVSQSKQKIFVAYDGATPYYQNTTTVVREYRYLTKSQAAAKVNSEATNNSRTRDIRVKVAWGAGGDTYKNISVRDGGSGKTAGTDKVATSRPQGRGFYTVSVNEITYQVTTS